MDERRITEIEKRQDRHEAMHTETMKNIGELVGELKVTNSQTSAVLERQDKIERQVSACEKDISNIKQEQAGMRPFVDLVKTINTRILLLLLSALGAMMTVVYVLAA